MSRHKNRLEAANNGRKGPEGQPEKGKNSPKRAKTYYFILSPKNISLFLSVTERHCTKNSGGYTGRCP